MGTYYSLKVTTNENIISLHYLKSCYAEYFSELHPIIILSHLKKNCGFFKFNNFISASVDITLG